MIDLNTTLRLDRPELRVQIDRDRAADLRVDIEQIATALRLMVGGDQEVSRFHDPLVNEDYDVQLRLSEADRRDPRTIERLYVSRSSASAATALGAAPQVGMAPGGGLVRLDNVVKIAPAQTAARIDRSDRQRENRLRGVVAPGYGQADRIDALRQATVEMNLPAGYRPAISGRAREFEKTFVEFLWVFLLAVIFMYMILASQFESLIHPLTILLSLPLAAPFALLSLWYTGNTLNLYSALGILVLFGVVKKNAILQIDQMNALRAAGHDRRTAILLGNRNRLRPILMTTLALVAGMLPLWLGTGPGAEERRAIAVVVIGGQTLSLLLTLLITPVAYLLFEDLARGLGRLRFRRRDRRVARLEPAYAGPAGTRNGPPRPGVSPEDGHGAPAAPREVESR
jgi:HAE1 family hydrophobic/amphiphilic exporter-1